MSVSVAASAIADPGIRPTEVTHLLTLLRQQNIYKAVIYSCRFSRYEAMEADLIEITSVSSGAGREDLFMIGTKWFEVDGRRFGGERYIERHRPEVHLPGGLYPLQFYPRNQLSASSTPSTTDDTTNHTRIPPTWNMITERAEAVHLRGGTWGRVVRPANVDQLVELLQSRLPHYILLASNAADPQNSRLLVTLSQIYAQPPTTDFTAAAVVIKSRWYFLNGGDYARASLQTFAAHNHLHGGAYPLEFHFSDENSDINSLHVISRFSFTNNHAVLNATTVTDATVSTTVADTGSDSSSDDDSFGEDFEINLDYYDTDRHTANGAGIGTSTSTSSVIAAVEDDLSPHIDAVDIQQLMRLLNSSLPHKVTTTATTTATAATTTLNRKRQRTGAFTAEFLGSCTSTTGDVLIGLKWDQCPFGSGRQSDGVEYRAAAQHLPGGRLPLRFIFDSQEAAAVALEEVTVDEASLTHYQLPMPATNTRASPPTAPNVKRSMQLDDESAAACVICLQRARDFAYVPCGHRVLCAQCKNTVLNNSRSSSGSSRFPPHQQPLQCAICKGVCSSIIRIFG